MKVTDFGIARAGTSDGLTQTGSVMGTATYFSPEQAQGLAVDGRSDVYSLGVVLYEMVCGVPPFVARLAGERRVQARARGADRAVATAIPTYPPRSSRSSSSALAKDPEHRYQSADDLRADILRFRRGRPLVGRADHRDRLRSSDHGGSDRRSRRTRGRDRRQPPRPRRAAPAVRPPAALGSVIPRRSP